MTSKPCLARILLVDDEPANIQVLNGILAEDDYEIFFATDGETACSLAISQEPDLILLDVMMPGVDGYEICRRLKGDHATADIPVIFITALNQTEDEEKGLNLGAIDYITKPLSPAIVRARVRNHIQLKRYRDRLEKMAVYDGLTGIANRQYFNQVVDAELKRAIRSKTTLSIALLDIDCFKQFNDNYVHSAGDDCLKDVATALSESLDRPSDLIARYGGEEFVCVLPETDSAGANEIVERLLNAIRSLNIPHGYSSAVNMVTASVGCITANAEPHLTVESMITEADRLLYKAKNNGRNRRETGVL